MTVYSHHAGMDRPPLRRPDAHSGQLTALMVPVRVAPAGRAWVPPARPAVPTTPPPAVDVSAIDLGRWSLLDLLLVPLALWLAEGDPGRHRSGGRHRHHAGDRPRPADGPSTRGMGRRRTPAAGWTHTGGDRG